MAGELVERLRRRAEAMFALSDVSRNTSAAWRIEAKACLAKGSTDGITAADRIEALERENATLRAERDEARKALEPFAQAANGFDRIPKQVGGKRALGVPDDFHILKTLTVGDLRRARAASIIAGADLASVASVQVGDGPQLGSIAAARKQALEEAAAICDGQAKYFRDLSNNPKCLNDLRWDSREEAQFTMQAYAERHESDAAAIRNMGGEG